MTNVDVVVPVYNEQEALPKNIPLLYEFLASEAFAYDWRIVIADNASTDGTRPVAEKLAQELTNVEYLFIPAKGRGRALREAWGRSTMDIVSYMDVDLSTALEAFPALIGAIADKGYDIAIGSRLARGAQLKRTLKREVLSRGYNLLIKALFMTRFSDAQCGFKAAKTGVAQRLIPLIEDGSWFFDTELLVIAEKMGFAIAEIPVRWQEDLDTRVQIGKTVWDDIKGLVRLRVSRPWREKRRSEPEG